MRVSFRALFGDEADVIRERNFQVLILANMTGPIGIALLSPVLGSLTGPFDVSPANIGLMMSAYTAPMILVIPLVGLLSDRYGRKPTLIAGILLSGTGGVAIAFTTDFRVALALRLLQGIGGSAIVPIVITSVGDLYERVTEATAQGIRYTSTGVVQVVIPAIAGILAGIAWQYPFFLFLLAFPVAVVVYLLLDETGPSADNAEMNAKTGVRADPSSDSIRNLLAHRRVFATVLGRGIPAGVWIAFLTYNSIVVVQVRDGNPAQAGLVVAIASLAIAIASTQAGRITTLFESRFYPLVAGHLLLSSGFVVVLFVPVFAGILGGSVLAGSGLGILMSIYRSFITDLATKPLRGRLVSVSETSGRLFLTVTPAVMGSAIALVTPRLGFELAVQTIGFCVALAAVVVGILSLTIAHTGPRLPHEY